MNAHTSLLGVYQPGDGWLFRLPIGWKYLLMLAVAVPPVLVREWWITAAALIVVLVALLTSRVSLGRILDVGWYLWVLLGVMVAYQLISLLPVMAFVGPGNLLAAVLAARMLTLTTSTPDLMDALARALGPLRHVGVNPRAVTLTIALMIRSIPFLAGAVQDARDAAHARGRTRNPVALLTPAVVGAVAYAQRTGEALEARGLPR
ncbi:energy-coupling factor transporter transmembrane component T family protein [Tessaracoccus caeni]|uniref:energy-coupling factor transporter transmembrane component T family protein n=1 Tax=Tessaracoccus caeni TaxID=3031239 RepID=UPI0023DBB4C9|nr:energy-coupling factor transporter transmembrane protein EcfT [Tessaracoccus caeni]MDF1487859.1 energy-coupling factor transporter transmembrane protein EcfT [Tessaracoccus caeni]